MDWIVVIPAALAFVSWLVAAGSALELALRHPREGRGLMWYGVRGTAFLDPDNFAPSGAKAHQRMMFGMLGFLVSAGLGAMLTVMIGVRETLPP